MYLFRQVMRINELKYKMLSAAQEMFCAVTIHDDDDDDGYHHHPHPHDHNSLQITTEDSAVEDKLDRLYVAPGKGK